VSVEVRVVLPEDVAEWSVVRAFAYDVVSGL